MVSTEGQVDVPVGSGDAIRGDLIVPGAARGVVVFAPTLLIVGGLDPTVIDLNREAHDRMRAERSLEIVPGATHLFEEPGALDHVARRAGEWFTRHLTACSRPGRTP